MTLITFEMVMQVLMVIMASTGMMMPTMTRHAETAHQGQMVNAEAMVGTMEQYFNGNQRVCASLDVHLCTHYRGAPSPHAKVLCTKWNGRVDGMVIGLRDGVPVIVTAYTARATYWLKGIPRDRCVPLNLTVLEGYFRVMYPGLFK